MGVHGYLIRNNEGGRISEFVQSKNMSIVNTFFLKYSQHLITYRSGNTASQIDYLLTRTTVRKYVTDCKVYASESVSAQHRPVTSFP